MQNSDLIIKNRKEHSDTLCWCLGFNIDSEIKIKKYVNEYGTRSFLLKFKCLNFSNEEIGKIEVLKRVIEKYDGDIENVDFGDE
jgi:hypothetical protein